MAIIGNGITTGAAGLDEMITVSDTEPTVPSNKVWVKETSSDVIVPTVEDFEDFVDTVILVQDAQPTDNDNSIWIKPDDNAIEIPTMDDLDAVSDEVSDVKNAIDKINSDLAETAYRPEQIYLGDSNKISGAITIANNWSTTSGFYSSLVARQSYAKQLAVIAGSKNCSIGLLKSVPTNPLNFATGINGRIVVSPGESRVIEIPDDCAWITFTNEVAQESYLPISAEFVYLNTVDNVERFVSSDSEIKLTGSNVLLKYIETRAQISSMAPVSPRLLAVPFDGVFQATVNVDVSSTKRIGLCDSLDAGSIVYNYQQITGTLDIHVVNTGHKYLVVQLFINSDTEQDYQAYLDKTVITVTSNTDIVARNAISDLSDRFYYAESLKSLPILNSFSDIDIDTTSYSSSAAYHTLMRTLCSNSDGYITQTLLGNDGHGNELYKYVTNPKALRYSLTRSDAAPTVPLSGGKIIDPLTILISSNIHGREKNGNWVVYNLLSKLLSADTNMLRFFRDRVRFVCVPFICASGDYANADGININRDFPTTYDGTCSSAEGTLLKSVIDEYGKNIFMHIDVHTFLDTSAYANYVTGWIFTDSEKLAQHSVVSSEYVLEQYVEKYPTLAKLQLGYVGSTNVPTTCTYYTQQVYGAYTGTIEGISEMDGSPAGADSHTSAVAYLYDLVTHTFCSMI